MKHDDIAQDKKMIKKAVRMHDDQLHEGKKTRLKGLKKGGVTSAEMKKMGRNLARVANQKSK
jgi:hypothetical protein